MVLVLQKWGNSNAVRLPKKVIEKLNWEVDQELDFTVTEEGLTLKAASKNLDNETLFMQLKQEIEQRVSDVQSGKYYTDDDLVARYGL